MESPSVTQSPFAGIYMLVKYSTMLLFLKNIYVFLKSALSQSICNSYSFQVHKSAPGWPIVVHLCIHGVVTWSKSSRQSSGKQSSMFTNPSWPPFSGNCGLFQIVNHFHAQWLSEKGPQWFIAGCSFRVCKSHSGVCNLRRRSLVDFPWVSPERGHMNLQIFNFKGSYVEWPCQIGGLRWKTKLVKTSTISS